MSQFLRLQQGPYRRAATGTKNERLTGGMNFLQYNSAWKEEGRSLSSEEEGDLGNSQAGVLVLRRCKVQSEILFFYENDSLALAGTAGRRES
jgi:hypothetical protein